MYSIDTEENTGLERFRKKKSKLFGRQAPPYSISTETEISRKLLKSNEIRMHEIRKGKHMSVHFPFIIDENMRMLYSRFFLISLRMCH